MADLRSSRWTLGLAAALTLMACDAPGGGAAPLSPVCAPACDGKACGDDG
jgi:hypothetical protein